MIIIKKEYKHKRNVYIVLLEGDETGMTDQELRARADGGILRPFGGKVTRRPGKVHKHRTYAKIIIHTD